jgi:hypothetical protein
MSAFVKMQNNRESPQVADSGLMHCNIRVCCRKAPLNGKNRPKAVICVLAHV